MRDMPDVIDHINRDRSDNRYNNLRNVDVQINTRNKSTNKNNKSGITGVTIYQHINKNGTIRVRYKAQINGGNKFINSPHRKTLLEAVNDRRNLEIQYKYTYTDLPESAANWLKRYHDKHTFN